MSATEKDHGQENAKGWLGSILEMVAELTAADESGDEDRRENARVAIQESVLSVEIRDGWRAPGAKGEPHEYSILLTTGGPALRLTGNLDEDSQPDEWPRLEFQDWFTPWAEYLPARAHREALQQFALTFYFGE